MRTSAPHRRFSNTAAPDPGRVVGLKPGHPALSEARSIFPSSRVAAERAPRLLVSGINQRKLGDRVSKGAWRGFPIFALTLEERKTCPSSCHHWSDCYGNAMPFARRLEHGPALEAGLDREIGELQARHSRGFVVRLHILGDFYSVGYVERWRGWLQAFPALHVFGYTAWGLGTAIGDAVTNLAGQKWDRFAVRLSCEIPGPGRAITVAASADRAGVVICPAQTGKTACCGTCGVCWSPAARAKTIGFLPHGMVRRGKEKRKEPLMAEEAQPPKADAGPKPELGWLPVARLSVDGRYQRNLESRRSQKLIARIVERFSWSAFQAIVVTECEDGWAIIDGQHRWTAAKKRGETHVPAIIVKALSVAEQAAIFVSANENRVAVNPFALFHAKLAAKFPSAWKLSRICEQAGLSIPRHQVRGSLLKPGETLALNALERILADYDEPAALLAISAVARAYRGRPTAMRAMLFLAVAEIVANAENQKEKAAAVTALLAAADPDALFMEGRQEAEIIGISESMGLERVLARRLALPSDNLRRGVDSDDQRHPAVKKPAGLDDLARGPIGNDPNESLAVAVSRRCQKCNGVFQTKMVAQVRCQKCAPARANAR